MVDKQHIGQLVRDGEFEAALVFLQSGGCKELSREEWIEQDMARSRTPISLICDRQYSGARGGVHPLEAALARELIKAGCPVDAVDDYGAGALGYAAANGMVETVKDLLSAGADPNGPGLEWPPLLSALSSRVEGALASAWALLEAGADPDARSVDVDQAERPSVREMAGALEERRGRSMGLEVLLAFEERQSLLGSAPAAKNAGAPIRM